MMPSDPASDLSLLSISEDLVPSPIPIPSQQVILPFDDLLSPPLVLQTNEKQCGGKLWPAGMVLADYLLRNKMADVEGKTMFVRSTMSPFLLIRYRNAVYPHAADETHLGRVELGAGSGLVGLALAMGLKPTTGAPSFTKIHLTDGHAPLLPLLQHNIDLNKPHLHKSTSVVSNLLSWGQPLCATIPCPPDVVVAADCCYLESNVPLLVKTMETLMGKDTVCYFCYKKRRRADKDVIRKLSKLFEVEEIKGEWDKDGVFLYEMNRKSILRAG